MLVGVVAAVRPGPGGMAGFNRQDAVEAVLFYSLVYTVANLGAFGVVMAFRRQGREVREIADLAGLGRRHPLLGALMGLFLLSLAGLPPLAGFFGKLFLIRALVGLSQPLPWLIVLFALTSAVSFYYYLAPVCAMYMQKPEAEGEVTLSRGWPLRAALAVSALGTLLLGLWAGGGMALAHRVAETFGAGSPSALR
jgi:NADH-quinone oxidoreductase subunit N